MFSRTSRYAQQTTTTYVDAAGRTIAYVTLRVVPLAAGQTTHRVVQGDRIDLLAYRYLGDSEQYWRVCDANRATRPADLCAVTGRRLAVPLSGW